MNNQQAKLKQTLKEAGRSATKRRSLVFAQLHEKGPVGIGELARTMAPDIDRATVYRTVELFEQLGIINRVWRGFKYHVELSEIFTPHHHHALCQNCGKTTDISSSELESVLSRLAREHHFLTLNHSVELLGYCQQCQNK